MTRIHCFSIISLMLLIFSFAFCARTVLAQMTSTQTINAEILSNIWYSTTTVNEKETINIYAGFQNHSSKNLSGVAGFYIDDIEIVKSDFTANSKSLIKLETPYVTVKGNHKVQIKILEINDESTASLSISNLLASQTEKKDLDVQYEITKEVIVEKASNIANTVVQNVNKYAENLANYVESLKKPAENINSTLTLATTSPTEQTTGNTTIGTQGTVLGTTTDTKSTEQNKKDSSFYNSFLGLVAFLIRKWIWILSAIFLLIIFSMFRRD